MLPSIEQLLVIQDRDQKLKAFRTELSALPLQKQRIEHALAASSSALEQAKQRTREVELQRKKLELTVQSRQEQVARYKSQQMQTRKNEEFQALSNEIARVETEIIGLEDQEIELMEEAELLQGKIREAEKAFQAAKTQSEVQLAGLKTKDDTLRSRIAEIESERVELVKTVDQNLLFQYNRLFASKGGDAVVPIEHQVCTGCHMKNTPTVAHRAKSGREVVTCEQCGRILYWQGD
jgi:predicted  nucleic acid-binding Zn-ribbon protein